MARGTQKTILINVRDPWKGHVQRALERQGYNLVFVDSFDQAQEYLRTQRPDLVITCYQGENTQPYGLAFSGLATRLQELGLWANQTLVITGGQDVKERIEAMGEGFNPQNFFNTLYFIKEAFIARVEEIFARLQKEEKPDLEAGMGPERTI